MSLDQHVQVTLRVNSGGVARRGFGTPMILSHNASWSDRIRYYTSLSGITDDGFASDSPEARAAGEMFAQQPRPVQIAIGRAASLVTQRYKLSVEGGSVVVGHTYSARIEGEGFVDTTVSYTAQGGDDQDDVMSALKALIDAIADINFATSGPTSHVVALTGSSAGDWFSVGVTPRSGLKLVQDHDAPSGTTLADDLDAIVAQTPLGSDWYWVETLYNSEAYIDDVSSWVEDNDRFYNAASCDSDAANVSTGSTPTDAPYEINLVGRKRTHMMYHPRPAAFSDAGLTGLLAPRTPGSYTAAYKTIVGVEPTSLTDTQVANLAARRCSYYKQEAGVSFLWQGQVGNTDNGFLDVTVGLDAFVNDLQVSLFNVLKGKDKVGFVDADISMLTGAGKGAIARGIKSGIVAPGVPGDDNDPIPTLTFPRVADIDSSERAARELPDGECTFRYNHAVHKVLVDVTVTP
jgi:hypothetical protein